MKADNPQHLQSYRLQRRFAAQGLLEKIQQLIREHQLKVQIRKERNQLEQLPDHLLDDLGITREQARHESQRRFDDVPASRKLRD